MPVVLFYERNQVAKALSERYMVKPTPDLIQDIERLFGSGTVKIK